MVIGRNEPMIYAVHKIERGWEVIALLDELGLPPSLRIEVVNSADDWYSGTRCVPIAENAELRTRSATQVLGPVKLSSITH